MCHSQESHIEKVMGGPELISGDAVHLIRLTFWGESNGPMTSGITANPHSTPMSYQAL